MSIFQRNTSQRFEMFILSLAHLFDGLVGVITLGFVASELHTALLWSDWMERRCGQL